MPKWDKELFERFEQRKKNTSDLREKVLEEAWRKFDKEFDGLIKSKHTKNAEEAIEAARDTALAYLIEQIVRQPWFSPKLDDTHDLSRVQERLRCNLGTFDVGDLFPTGSIPVSRVIIAQMAGGIVGLSVFGVVFWPAPISDETKVFLSFLCGSIGMSTLLLLVNQHWRIFVKGLKRAGLITASSAALLFLFRYSLLGSKGAIVNTLALFGRLKDRLKENSSNVAVKDAVSKFVRKFAGPGKATILAVLLLIMVLILARPQSKFDGGLAEKQFKRAAQRWLDHALLMAVSIEMAGDLSKLVENGANKTPVSEIALKNLIDSIQTLRDANDIESFEEARDMVIERIAACGYIVGSDSKHYFERLNIKQVSYNKEGLNAQIIIWEDRLDEFFSIYGTIAEGQHARVLQEPKFRDDNTVVELGKVGRV